MMIFYKTNCIRKYMHIMILFFILIKTINMVCDVTFEKEL